MRTRNIFSTTLVALLIALAAAGAAAQQPAPGDAQQQVEAERRAAAAVARQRAEAEREAAEAAREQERAAREQRAEVERDSREQRTELERNLEEARAELQDAAREVARLSSQLSAPFVDGIERVFRFAGQRSMLGIGIEDTERGVRIASVSPNGPAAEAGLKVGDMIIAIDGAMLADTRVAGGGTQSPSELLLTQMANVDAGETVKLRVLNESGAERDATVKAGEISTRIFARNPIIVPPKGQNYSYSYRYGGPGSWFVRSSPWAQMQLVTLTPVLGAYFGASKGLLVVRGPERDVLGLRDGDVILDIGGREPTTPEHAIRILGSFEAGEPMKITIMREKRRQVLDVKVPAEGDG
jgi:C-terminal processing protease CtpA/Prc